jgi:hypothetical protein
MMVSHNLFRSLLEIFSPQLNLGVAVPSYSSYLGGRRGQCPRNLSSAARLSHCWEDSTSTEWEAFLSNLLFFPSRYAMREDPLDELKKRMGYYDRGLKKIISVPQRLVSASHIHSDNEEEGDDSRSMEHRVAIEQVAV